MTPLPKKKHTKARTGKRRGGQTKMSIPNLVKCVNCGHLRQSHMACPECGFYGTK